MSSLRRVRTADGRRVVDVADWCRVEHLAPEDLPDIPEGSIYAALADRGLAVDHGVAQLTPRNADGDLARRLGVPRGTLLLTFDQVDRSADGVPVLVSREHYLADAFTFSLLRRGPGEGDRLTEDAPLVVGVDVGSQGTCAQALEPDGTLVATTYEPHALSYPQAGWAEQDPGQWTAALVATLSRIRAATAGREIVALSFGSQLDGLVAAAGDGRPLHPALIWCDRRAGAECEAAAERVDPDALRALTGCNLDPGHVASKIAWLARHAPEVHGEAERFLLPGSWVAWRASGTLGVDPSNASSTGLLDPRTREWAPEACAAFDVDPEQLGAGPATGRRARPDPRLAAGGDGAGRRHARRHGGGGRDGRDARRGRRRPGGRVRRDGHGRAGVRRGVRARARPDRARRAAPARRSGDLAAGEPRLALRRRLPLVPRRARRPRGGGRRAERRRRLRAAQRARRVRATRRRRRLVGAGAGGRHGAGVELARAGRLVRDDRRPRARPPRPRAARGQRAGAARRDRGDRRRRASAERGGLRRRRSQGPAAVPSCARTSPACRCPGPTTSRRPRAGPRCSPRPARSCTRASPPPGSRWPARAASRCSRTRSCAAVYDDLHRRHRRLYAALRPLFEAEDGG